MVGSGNSAADKAGHNPNSFSKIVPKVVMAEIWETNSNSAHEELVAESRIREKFPDLLPIRNSSPDSLTPLQEKALLIWWDSDSNKASAQISPTEENTSKTTNPSPLLSKPSIHISPTISSPTQDTAKAHNLTRP